MARLMLRDDKLDRSRIIVIRWIVDLRTIRNYSEYVHFRTQFDVAARRRNAACDRRLTSALDRHAHEEIDIRHDVPAPHPELFQTFQEILATAGAIFHAIEHVVACRAASATDGVVRPVGVLDDCE